MRPIRGLRNLGRHPNPSHVTRHTKEGQIFLSRDQQGNVFGHSWNCKSKNPHAAAMLYLAARKKAREWSGGKLTIHFTDSDRETREFWQRRGFRLKYEIFEGTV